MGGGHGGIGHEAAGEHLANQQGKRGEHRAQGHVVHVYDEVRYEKERHIEGDHGRGDPPLPQQHAEEAGEAHEQGLVGQVRGECHRDGHGCHGREFRTGVEAHAPSRHRTAC